MTGRRRLSPNWRTSRGWWLSVYMGVLLALGVMAAGFAYSRSHPSVRNVQVTNIGAIIRASGQSTQDLCGYTGGKVVDAVQTGSYSGLTTYDLTCADGSQTSVSVEQ